MNTRVSAGPRLALHHLVPGGITLPLGGSVKPISGGRSSRSSSAARDGAECYGAANGGLLQRV
jgi:hypothetical protein